MSSCGRKVFLDIGGWNGCSARFWRKNHPHGGDFELHVFECDKANLRTLEQVNASEGLGMIIIPKAAWVDSRPQRFHTGASDGGSMFSGKITGGIRPDVYVEVESMDLAEYIRNLLPCDELVIKMNAEGAEYPLIRHLNDQGLIPFVSRWYMQWHHRKIGISQKEHDSVVNMLPCWFPWRAQHGDKFRSEFLETLR